MLVDSHCHLDFPDFEDELEDVIARAGRAGVGAMVTIGTEIARFDRVLAIARAHDNIYCTVGTHPHEAGADGEAGAGPEHLVALAANEEVIGIGETGLDYHYDNAPRAAQQVSFRAHIEAARETGLALIVHSRDADDDTIEILTEEHKKGPFGAVMHCFSAGRALADAAVGLGFYISFSGILTFKNADAVREIAAAVPADRLLVETDAPYLAPVPKRGKRNEPAFVTHTAAYLAEIRGMTAEELAEQTTANFFRLFTKAKAPAGGRGLKPMRITILGCGAAGGVPMIGGQWGECDPENPRNRRRRASILVENGETAVLVDTSPDLRQQLLDADVSRLDGVIHTHDHADHVHGIDELRALNRLQRQWIDLYANAGTLNGLRKRFGYIFEPERKVPDEFAFYKPCLTPHEIAPGGVFTVGTLKIEPFDQDHGFMRTIGLRFGHAAYTTDAVDLPESAFTALRGLKLWIVGCLRYEPHPTHAHLDKVLEWIERVKPERAVLTHLGTHMDYDALAARLPEGVTPAYDGLVLEIK